MSTDFLRLEKLWKPSLINSSNLRYFRRPAAVRYVEKKRAGSLLHVHGVRTGQSETHIVLWAKNVRDASKDFGLVVANPEELGQGKVRQSRIACQLDKPLASNSFMQPVALRIGSLIAPDQRWPQHVSIRIKHHRAVHL